MSSDTAKALNLTQSAENSPADFARAGSKLLDSSPLAALRLVVEPGRNVLELRPPSVDKGGAYRHAT